MLNRSALFLGYTSGPGFPISVVSFLYLCYLSALHVFRDSSVQMDFPINFPQLVHDKAAPLNAQLRIFVYIVEQTKQIGKPGHITVTCSCTHCISARAHLELKHPMLTLHHDDAGTSRSY
jgi:hypothetical protein